MRDQAAAELEAALKRREDLARERIAQAEAKAVAEVRAATVDVAVEAARRALVESVTGPRADALIAQALKDIPDKLH
jgi:F-type H+-transporting ATPase subunit b